LQSTSSISSLIWSSADDVLRGLFKPSEYGRVILPFVVMRRLDCVLEPKKEKVYELYQKFKDQDATSEEYNAAIPPHPDPHHPEENE